MLKDLLLGVGITLIVLSLILLVIDNPVSRQDGKLSQEEIIKKARKIGMTFPGSGIKRKDNNLFSLDVKTSLNLPTPSQSESSSEEIIINIPTGISARETASLLLKNDLIQDKKSFVELLTKFDLENKIRAGRYTLQGNISSIKLLLRLTVE